MFLVENLGESIYKALASKVSNEEMISIYKKLSINEIDTAGFIANELKRMELAVPRKRKVVLKVVADTAFSLLSHNILETLLKKILKKRMFRSWFNMYHDNNEKFWKSMIDHETLQYELLNL